MGLKTRHLSEQHIVLKNLGTQSAAELLDFDRAWQDCHIANIWAQLGTAGATGTQVVDVNKNGVTIFSAAGKITFGEAVSPSSYSGVTSRQVAKGDKFSIDVDSVNSGTAAEDLEVHIVLVERDPGLVTNLAPSALPVRI